MKSKVLQKLIRFIETDNITYDSDFYQMIQEICKDQVAFQCYTEAFEMVLVKPGKVRRLRCYPPFLLTRYHFCPDRRIRTHRLFGKPALGPSPPFNEILQLNNTGIICDR